MSHTNNYKHFTVLEERTAFNRKFRVDTTEYIIKIKEYEDAVFGDVRERYNAIFEEIINSFINTKTDVNSKIGLKLRIPNIPNAKPIGLSLRSPDTLSAQIVTDLISNVMQSNTSFSAADELEIVVQIIQLPSGGAVKRLLIKNMSSHDILKYKTRSIINVEADDVNCLPRAIMIGKCLANHDDQILKKLLRKNSGVLKQSVIKLLKSANIKPDKETGCNIGHVFKIEKTLKNYQIVVYHDKSDYQNVLYRGADNSSRINLFYFDDIKHFVVIKNLKGFFNYDYLCNYCEKMFNSSLNKHHCKAKCGFCYTTPPCQSVLQMKHCEDCNRSFRGPECFLTHKTHLLGYDVVCKNVFICRTCFSIVNLVKRGGVQHTCGEKVCVICNKIQPTDHQCFIQPYKKIRPKRFVIIFYDIECTQNTKHDENCDSYTHLPNLCIAEQVCNECTNDGEIAECKNCKQRVHVFKGKRCIEEFIDFCEVFRKVSNSIFCIAHNFKGYDGQHIMQELLRRGKSVEPIMDGLKLLKITYDHRITFIDSLAFLPMALAKFPKAFGFNELQKGYYPHLFNTDENWAYVGEIPSKKNFITDNFNEKELRLFNEWHDSLKNSNYVYNNQEELIKYCKMDVELLRKGCVKFMNDFVSLLDVNPFLEAFTLSQAVLKVYRKLFMKENTLGVVPPGNYHSRQNRSFIADKWLLMENKMTNDQAIQFEVILQPSGISVDAFHAATNTVYEFLVR